MIKIFIMKMEYFYKLQVVWFIDRYNAYSNNLLLHTDQYIVNRIVDEHGDVHLFSVFLEQFID